MGAVGLTSATPTTQWNLATKTLVITVSTTHVYTLVFANSNSTTLYNVTISLACPSISYCSGPAVAGNSANWAGIGFGDGAWATNF